MTSGFFGSKATSVKPVLASIVFTAFHVLPPSVVRYSPRSPPLVQSGPAAATKTMLALFGLTTMRPMCSDFLRPMFVHVFPPFSDLYTPSPHDELRWLFASPVPTQTMSGLLGATAMSPMEAEA